jgi:hypothetical protein
MLCLTVELHWLPPMVRTYLLSGSSVHLVPVWLGHYCSLRRDTALLPTKGLPIPF